MGAAVVVPGLAGLLVLSLAWQEWATRVTKKTEPVVFTAPATGHLSSMSQTFNPKTSQGMRSIHL